MTSLSYPAASVQVPEDDRFTERLRGLSGQQLLEAMQFLAWWSPGAFTAVLDYCEVGDWGADDFDPDLSLPASLLSRRGWTSRS